MNKNSEGTSHDHYDYDPTSEDGVRVEEIDEPNIDLGPDLPADTVRFFEILRRHTLAERKENLIALWPKERGDAPTKARRMDRLGSVGHGVHSWAKTANERGFGVFFTSQEVASENSGTAPKTRDVARIRCVFAELDDGLPKGGFPITPTMLTETSPGKYHAYWVVSDELTVEAFKSIMGRLVQSYGSDPNAKDTVRMLRVAGFFHTKGTPYRVNIVSPSIDEEPVYYSAAELIAAFPAVGAHETGNKKARSNTPQSVEKLGRVLGIGGKKDFDPDLIEAALGHLKFDDYGDWTLAGMCLYHAGAELDRLDEAFVIFDEWSAHSKKYDAEKTREKWATFRDYDGPVRKLGTLFDEAEKRGWVRPDRKSSNGGVSEAEVQGAKSVVSQTFAAFRSGDKAAFANDDAVSALATLKAGDPAQYVVTLAEMKDAGVKGLTDLKSAISKTAQRSKSRGGNEGPKPSEAIVEAVLARADLFRTPNKQPFASIEREGHREAVDMASDDFERWIRGMMFRATKSVVSDAQLKEALSTLKTLAVEEGAEHKVYRRVAEHEGAIWLDLGDTAWRSVKITSDGWSVETSAPVRFIRSEMAQPFPEPVPGGKLDKLWPCVNIPEADRVFVLAWLLESLRPGTPYPVLNLRGPAGSAKSSTHKALVALYDPSNAPLQDPPSSVGGLVLACSHSHGVNFENVSFLSTEVQNTLCAVATGATSVMRKLYSNLGTVGVELKNPVIVNGIEDVITRTDLKQRTIIIELPEVVRRLSECEVRTQFDAVKGDVFGGLLDLMVKALKILPTVDIDRTRAPRLIDFTTFGEAISRALGGKPGTFVEAYSERIRIEAGNSLDTSSVGVALRSFVERQLRSAPGGGTSREVFSGPMSKLLTKLKAPEVQYDRDDRFPTNPRQLSDHIRRLSAVLKANGIEVEKRGIVRGTSAYVVRTNDNWQGNEDEHEHGRSGEGKSQVRKAKHGPTLAISNFDDDDSI